MPRRIIRAKDCEGEVTTVESKGRQLAGLSLPSRIVGKLKKDDYIERAVKYIPQEVISPYNGIMSILMGHDLPESVVWVLYLGFLLLTPWILRMEDPKIEGKQLIVSFVAFHLWAVLVGNAPSIYTGEYTISN